MTARDIPEAIQWHEGMLLSPEHFRQMTMRQEMLSEYGMACFPFCWGLRPDPNDPRRPPYDPNLLASGQLAVTELEAVMPDGTAVHCGPGADLTLDLKPLAERMKLADVPVYLVLPARKLLAVKGDLERYSSVAASPGDMAQTGAAADSVEIPRLRPRLSLMAGPDPIPPRYSGFPLVRLRYENGAFMASSDFVAPLLSVSRSSRIGRLCSEVARHIREKASYLADMVRSMPPETSTRRLLQIQSLVGSLPAFEALLYTDRAHPYALYLALCSLAGNIAGVGYGLVPPVFPAYDHHDPRNAFDRVKAYIDQAIDEGISERWLSFRFHREEKRYTLSGKLGWSAHMPEESSRVRGSVVLGIRGAAGASQERVLEWGRNCLIGSRSVIPSLIARRILGAPREPVDSLDDPLPAQGIALFSLTADPEWIRPDEDLQVFDPRTDALMPAEILLYLRRIL